MEEKVSSLNDFDKIQLELAKANKRIALAEAKEYIAKSEKADLEYKNYVLQIFMKYQLTGVDSIDENGNISYNALKKE